MQEKAAVPCLLRSHEVPATTASTSPIRQSPPVRFFPKVLKVAVTEGD